MQAEFARQGLTHIATILKREKLSRKKRAVTEHGYRHGFLGLIMWYGLSGALTGYYC